MSEARTEISTLDRILDEVEAGGGQDTPKERPAGDGGLGGLLSSPVTWQLLRSLGGGGGEQRTAADPDAVALLCALQPYLGGRRAAMLDRMLQLLRLGRMLQRLPVGELSRAIQSVAGTGKGE